MPVNKSTSRLVQAAASVIAWIAAGRQRRTAEIRVNHDSRAVDDLSQPPDGIAAGSLAQASNDLS